MSIRTDGFIDFAREMHDGELGRPVGCKWLAATPFAREYTDHEHLHRGVRSRCAVSTFPNVAVRRRTGYHWNTTCSCFRPATTTLRSLGAPVSGAAITL